MLFFKTHLGIDKVYYGVCSIDLENVERYPIDNNFCTICGKHDHRVIDCYAKIDILGNKINIYECGYCDKSFTTIFECGIHEKSCKGKRCRGWGTV